MKVILTLLLLTTTMATSLSSINYKARPKGTSKREYAASQLGGKLNYKSGQISVPAKSTQRWIPATQQQGGAGTFPVAAAPGYWQTVDGTPTNINSYRASDSAYGRGGSNVESAKPTINTTQRTTAAPALGGSNALGGKSFAQASTDANNKSGYGNGGFSSSQESGLNYVRGLMGNVAQAANDPFTVTGYGPNGELYYNGYDPAVSGGSIFQSDFATPGTNFSRPGSESAYVTSGTSPLVYGATQQQGQVDYGSRPTNVSPDNYSPGGGSGGTQHGSPKTVTKQNPQPTSDISSILGPFVKSLIEYGQPSQNQQPDHTPTQQNQGTVQRPVGMGQMSNGWASNGAGGYNFGGGGSIMGGGQNQGDQLTGTEGNNLLDELKMAFGGTPTAQAQEMIPQTNLDSGGWNNLMNSFQQGFNNGGLSQTGGTPFSYTGGSGVQNNNPVVEDKSKVKNPVGGSQTGTGATQQFAQGTTGGSKQQKFDNSGYKSQQKAQKKALDELIKSIKSQYATQTGTLNSQYDTSTKQGTAALENAKQQDLLKLSGLFNFGANQDPNSEQRIQYEQRTAGDYAGQLRDLLAKLTTGRTNDLTNLMTGQNQDISKAKQGYQSSLADIMQQQSKAQSDYQNQQWDRQYKMASLNKGGSEKNDSLTKLGVNSKGEPVFWNNRTKQQQVGTGLTNVNDPYTQFIQGQGQSGENFTGRYTSDGKKIYQDEGGEFTR